MKDIPHKERECSLNEKDLTCECSRSYKEYGNGDYTTCLEFTPVSFKAITYHVRNYRCSKCGDIKRAPGPISLFKGSLTPSLLAGIMTTERYFSLLFNCMKEGLLSEKIIHTNEMTVMVSKG